MATGPSLPLDPAEALKARESFRGRIESLEHDTRRCFWPINDPSAPGAAYFPPVMYCLATLDYFSSFWAGWNRKAPQGQNQTDRMTAFCESYLFYPRKEALLTVHFWRHKLMHTAEPRVIRDPVKNESYVWSTGPGKIGHMRLTPTQTPNEFLLHFSPFAFIEDLREGVFGAAGYFLDLRREPGFADKYRACLREFEVYEVTL